MNIRNFELELVGFCGFYDSIFSDYLDDSLNYDLECLHDSLSKLHINEFNCWYEWNYKQYEKDVAEIAMTQFLLLGNDMLK